MTRVYIEDEACRGYAELRENPEYHDFCLYLQTCDSELVNRIREWMETKE